MEKVKRSEISDELWQKIASCYYGRDKDLKLWELGFMGAIDPNEMVTYLVRI